MFLWQKSTPVLQAKCRQTLPKRAMASQQDCGIRSNIPSESIPIVQQLKQYYSVIQIISVFCLVLTVIKMSLQGTIDIMVKSSFSKFDKNILLFLKNLMLLSMFIPSTFQDQEPLRPCQNLTERCFNVLQTVVGGLRVKIQKYL